LVLVGTADIVGLDIDRLSNSNRNLARKIVQMLLKRNQAVHASGEGLEQVSSG
jgi:hypothetical protein